MSTITLLSTITCPICGLPSKEVMPKIARTWFCICKGCGLRLKPKPGDCCVFCSYGDVACPPKQCDAENAMESHQLTTLMDEAPLKEAFN